MKQKLKDAIDELRYQGYAVTVFNPEELSGVDPDEVEQIMVDKGNDAISLLKLLRKQT